MSSRFSRSDSHDPLAPFDFFQQTLSRWSAITERSRQTFTDIFARAKSGKYSFGDAVRDGSELLTLQCESVCELLTLPICLCADDDVPTVHFVRDAVSEYAEKKRVSIRAALDPTSVPVATALSPCSGSGAPRPGFLKVERSGNMLSIELVGLIHPTNPALSLPPGHYVASVYAAERGNPVELAVVHVEKLDPA